MKEDILETLRQGKFVSGTELATKLGVSKVAIWKNIQALKEEGYKIKSKPGTGYLLQDTPEDLVSYEIKESLENEIIGNEISCHGEVSSTQEIGKRLARKDANDGTVVVAKSQTSGRGRKKRKWFSPEGGLYISIILKPDILPAQAPVISLLTGVAVAKAIRKIANFDAELKWPNDIKIDGKKVGGILLEISAETDQVSWMVIGIGVNINNDLTSLSKDIKKQATSLSEKYGDSISRLSFLKKLLQTFEKLYLSFEKDGSGPILEEWRKLSSTLGSHVHISDGEEIEGTAVDVDDDGALVLKLGDENRRRILAGDVSLRKKE